MTKKKPSLVYFESSDDLTAYKLLTATQICYSTKRKKNETKQKAEKRIYSKGTRLNMGYGRKRPQ